MQPYLLIRKFCNASDETSIHSFESEVATAISQGGEPLGSTHIQTYTRKVNGDEELWIFLAQGFMWKQ